MRAIAGAIVLFGGFFLSAGDAAAGDRIGIRPGMSSLELVQAMRGRCLDNWHTPPYLTCIDGKTVIGASVTPKDRTWVVTLKEFSQLPARDYARELANELGFPGQGDFCMYGSYAAWCWQGEDGLMLYAAVSYPDNIFLTTLENRVIKTEDGDD